jgi:hypothetical protein
MAVDLEGVALLVLADREGPMQGRKAAAVDVDDRTMHFLDIA